MTFGLASPGRIISIASSCIPKNAQDHHHRNQYLDARTSEYHIHVWPVKWPWMSSPNMGKRDAMWSATPSATFDLQVEMHWKRLLRFPQASHVLRSTVWTGHYSLQGTFHT